MSKKCASQAVACFKNGFSCSQAVFSTYAELLGMDRDVALKVSGAFGGGMARMGETCGAVTGALMVIGLKHASANPDDEESKLKTYDLSREFVARFKSRHTTSVCRDLLGCDVGTEEGRRIFDERNYKDTRCSKFVEDAVTILEDIL